ncbi:hypothetical protein FB566_1147 [Stackebrandtia endophytica]|uniref:Uncharacterized protein n=1 Tax=Stackebrandtia endophytica TaxID=1496996 RepID=A0A543ASU0_9ACTN|nr:hypothetical protein [Stackebrandtia endophytica]TQL75638.1 hypothetical protein FB566_1147 [Stackebrandtia endophytica]
MIGHPAYRRLVRASAWYDLVVTIGFATPWTYVLVHDLLHRVTEHFGLGTVPPVEPMQILFANLMGSVVVVWSLLRLLRTSALHGLYDGIARVLFTLWQTYALYHGVTAVLWLFIVVEMVFGVAQLLPWLSRRTCLATG